MELKKIFSSHQPTRLNVPALPNTGIIDVDGHDLQLIPPPSSSWKRVTEAPKTHTLYDHIGKWLITAGVDPDQFDVSSLGKGLSNQKRLCKLLFGKHAAIRIAKDPQTEEVHFVIDPSKATDLNLFFTGELCSWLATAGLKTQARNLMHAAMRASHGRSDSTQVFLLLGDYCKKCSAEDRDPLVLRYLAELTPASEKLPVLKAPQERELLEVLVPACARLLRDGKIKQPAFAWLLHQVPPATLEPLAELDLDLWVELMDNNLIDGPIVLDLSLEFAKGGLLHAASKAMRSAMRLNVSPDVIRHLAGIYGILIELQVPYLGEALIKYPHIVDQLQTVSPEDSLKLLVWGIADPTCSAADREILVFRRSELLDSGLIEESVNRSTLALASDKSLSLSARIDMFARSTGALLKIAGEKPHLIEFPDVVLTQYTVALRDLAIDTSDMKQLAEIKELMACMARIAEQLKPNILAEVRAGARVLPAVLARLAQSFDTRSNDDGTITILINADYKKDPQRERADSMDLRRFVTLMALRPGQMSAPELAAYMQFGHANWPHVFEPTLLGELFVRMLGKLVQDKDRIKDLHAVMRTLLRFVENPVSKEPSYEPMTQILRAAVDSAGGREVLIKAYGWLSEVLASMDPGNVSAEALHDLCMQAGALFAVLNSLDANDTKGWLVRVYASIFSGSVDRLSADYIVGVEAARKEGWETHFDPDERLQELVNRLNKPHGSE